MIYNLNNCYQVNFVNLHLSLNVGLFIFKIVELFENLLEFFYKQKVKKKRNYEICETLNYAYLMVIYLRVTIQLISITLYLDSILTMLIDVSKTDKKLSSI